MAFQTARGNAKNTGAPGATPAPTRPAAPDQISRIRAPGQVGYGQNDGASNPSSIDPGKQLLSPMAANLKASSDDGEGVLDTIIKSGVRMDTGFQMRDIGSKNVPTHPHMTGASAGPKVPDKTGK